MELSRSSRPRVSRETRLLLSTAALAILALWMLARVRFPDQPAAATPLEPLLTQIRTRGTFDDLAFELADLRPRLLPFFVGSALRVRPDVALLPLGAGRGSDPGSVPGSDPVADPLSGLTAVRVAGGIAPPLPWRPTDLEQPRYLVAAIPQAGTPVLRPVLVGQLTRISHPIWRDVWRVPAGSEIPAGAFVFTTDARLVGVAMDASDGIILVPATALISEVDRLLASGPRTPGSIGIDVQALTPAIARATGATTGVVVTRVDPDGPAAAILAVGDVIETIDEEPLTAPHQWTTRAAVPVGHTLMVRVRRGDAVQTVGLIAAPMQTAPRSIALGLRLRNLSRTGSAVMDVEAGSAADRAGLRVGDVITLIGTTTAPSPAAVRRAFDRAPPGAAILVAYTRPSPSAQGGDTPAVTALEKP